MRNKESFIRITFFVIFIVDNLVGYIFDIDALRIYTPLRGGGVSMSIAAVIFPLLTTCLVYYALKHFGVIGDGTHSWKL